jgi:hypothetical protein
MVKLFRQYPILIRPTHNVAVLLKLLKLTMSMLHLTLSAVRTRR